jgi:hypothetical protein
MARYLKNDQIKTGSTAIQLPVGNTASRPEAPVNGQIRFNSDTQRFEIYYNAWLVLAITGQVAIVKDTFTGDGAQTQYTLSQIPVNSRSILVFVGNVHQNPDDAFTLNNAIITFLNPPPPGQSVVVFHNFSSTDAYAS